MKFLKDLFNNIVESRVLYAAVLIVFVAVAGPFLISAANTFLTIIGIALLVLLLWWGVIHIRNFFKNGGNIQ